MKYFSYISYIILITSCTFQKDKQLKYGSREHNKYSLIQEKVINHYKNDELKLQAAHYLIKNMLSRRIFPIFSRRKIST